MRLKKVNIPTSAFAGFAIVLVCLCGLIKGGPGGAGNILIVLVCAVVLALLIFFSIKSVRIEEKKTAYETRKKPMSKGKAAAQRDTEHMRRMLDIYTGQLRDLRRRAKTGLVYAVIALCISFIFWGTGRFAFTFFVSFSLVCIAYGAWCLFTLYLNSDSAEAKALAEKLNITTIKSKAWEAENAIWKNEMKAGDTLKVMDFTEDECGISDSGRVILETERLFLREMNIDDLSALSEVLSDPVNMQYYPHAFDETEVSGWIDKNIRRYSDDGFGLWAVCLKDTGEMIGDCGLTMQNINGEMLPEVGYHIRRDLQHKGYASEAARGVLDWAVKSTDHPAFYSYCRSGNAASIKTARSIGMHYMKEYIDDSGNMTTVSVIRREELTSLISAD